MAFNPMFGLHVRLMGSWRNQVIILLALFGLVAALANVTYRMADVTDHGHVSTVWLGIVSVAQAFFLMLIAPGAIRRAVQRDFDNGMMESHRLSPMSGFKIVLGYLTGPPAQAMLLFGANLLVGIYFAAQRGLSLNANVGFAIVAGWLFLQLCLLLLAFMMASLVLLTAVASAGKTQILGLVAVGGIVLGSWAWAFVPGLALVFGILSGIELLGAVIMQRAPSAAGANALTVVMAALAQVAFGVTFVVAACRRVRAPERAMFTLPLALVLLTIWGTALVLGVRLMPQMHPGLPDFPLLTTAQIICSTVGFMLVALFAIVAAANSAFRHDQAAAFGQQSDRSAARVARTMPALLAAMTLATAVLMFNQMRGAGRSAALETAFSNPATLAAFALAPMLSYWIDYCLVYSYIARVGKVFRSLIMWGLILKVLPLAADMALAIAREAGDGDRVRFADGVFTGISPFGTLALCCLEGGNPWPGLIVQIGLAFGATYLCLRAREQALRPTPRGPAGATA